MTTAEIVLDNPSMAFKVNEIDELRQVLLTEKYTPKFRQVEVSYLYGASGTGKTRGIFDKHPAEDICRITNYRGPPRGSLLIPTMGKKFLSSRNLIPKFRLKRC